MAVYGLVQQFGAEPLGVRWMNTEGRIFSFATNPTYLAGDAALLLPILLAVGATGSHGNKETNEETADTRRRRVIPGTLLVMAASVLIFDRFFEGQPNLFIIFAGALGIATLAATIWGGPPRVRPRRPPLPAGAAAYGLVVLLLGAALLLSLTFAAIGGLALGAAAAGGLTLVRARWQALRKVLLTLVAIAIIFPLLGGMAYPHLPRRQKARVDRVLHFKDPAASERQIHWRVAYDLFKERPLLGHGYSVFRVQSLEKMSAPWYEQRGKRVETTLTPNHAHNEFLQIFAETGVVGGALFLALCCGLLGAGGEWPCGPRATVATAGVGGHGREYRLPVPESLRRHFSLRKQFDVLLARVGAARGGNRATAEREGGGDQDLAVPALAVAGRGGARGGAGTRDLAIGRGADAAVDGQHRDPGHGRVGG